MLTRKRIGIMGGTFDPIHNGHLLMAEYSRIQFNLDKVLFIPTGIPPHKEHAKILPNKYRYDMVLLAINSNENFFLSTIEMDRKETTYTIDTINLLKSLYKDVDFYFIMGSDSLLQIHEWKDYKKLLGLCNFVVAKRPGYNNSNLDRLIEELSSSCNSSIYTLEASLLDISSSEIRNRVSKNLPISYLVPESVERYIYKNNLYR
ncbi:MAG TPA: nicotinate-nucleotide adenylyltransferase [Tissierellia bacterium]|nr:nicotinate-nucleotide adenylyltransferase [Tissierellia bacterium]